jgi:hypothetical protein
METARDPTQHLDPVSLSNLDEPVRRYFNHALSPGARLSTGVRLTMEGRIKVGAWLPFTAEWEGDGRSFVWRARAGVGPIKPLRVIDHYSDGTAGMDVRAPGRIPLVRAHDENTLRSAAGRAAIESAIWAPASLLPDRGVAWRAESELEIVASWDVPPERPEVHLRIDLEGGVRSATLLRWGPTGKGGHDYIPCGASVHAEARFGDIVIPSHLTVAWWFEWPSSKPFFEASVIDAVPIG